MVDVCSESLVLEINFEEEGHAWLDEIYFHEKADLPCLISGFSNGIVNQKTLQQENKAEIVLREQAQLNILEFQRPGGKCSQ
jgi:hypothetical protein